MAHALSCDLALIMAEALGSRRRNMETAPAQSGRAGRSFGLIEPVQVPWIRPGVVVHDPMESVDALLGGFALELRERGFGVHGYVHLPAPEGVADPVPRHLDLASARPLAEERGAAVRLLRRAMREDADLVVIGRFSACTEATDDVHPSIGGGDSSGLPLLTSIAGQCIHQWHSYVRHEGSMIAPDRRALWNWWGPDRLYRDLVLGVEASEVVRIACGPRWIMVEGPNGAGLAYLPRHPRDLLPRLPKLAGESLRSLAELSQSWDPLEAALGIAAVNAHYNRYDLDGRSGNGVRRFRGVPGRVVVIGAFPGVDAILAGCAVVETDPRPGEFPTAALETLLPGCGGTIVNSSALINRSLPRILRLARNRPFALIGPSTPLSPRLHDYGIGTLGGFIASDPQGLATAVRAGALPREFTRFGRHVHLANGDADTT
jgi:uncharacterized protein